MNGKDPRIEHADPFLEVYAETKDEYDIAMSCAIDHAFAVGDGDMARRAWQAIHGHGGDALAETADQLAGT